MCDDVGEGIARIALLINGGAGGMNGRLGEMLGNTLAAR